MKYVSIILVLTILAVWLFAAAQQFYAATKNRNARGLLGFLAGTFIAVGIIGFLGAALASMVDLLPASFEWPGGYAKGVVTTKDHYFVVPHTPSGRIQVYDNNWKFLRGWHVEASSGTFKLFVSDTNRIHVITARGRMHFAYDVDGKLLSTETYAPTGYSTFPTTGDAYMVPTPIWLWSFTSPFYSWLVAVAGLGIMIAKDKLQKGTKK